jgi:hypothetical protein
MKPLLVAAALSLSTMVAPGLADSVVPLRTAQAMARSVAIVLPVVSCKRDLLHCSDIDTGAGAFADMAECRLGLKAFLENMDAKASMSRHFMARCRYVLLQAGKDERKPDRGRSPEAAPAMDNMAVAEARKLLDALRDQRGAGHVTP